MYIFLDIDGVLNLDLTPDHSDGKIPPALHNECLHIFENVIRSHPLAKFKIVISSSWRQLYSLKTLRSMFSADIQPLVVGVTPDTFGMYQEHERYSEILRYLDENEDKDFDWVAVDDQPHQYLANTDVIITKPSKGFDEEAAKKLEGMMTQNIA